jgi:hypothetical protein
MSDALDSIHRVARLQWGEDEWGEGEKEEEIPAPAGASIMEDQPEEERAAPGPPVPLKRVSLSLSFLSAIPLAGEIGAGSGAPTYAEAFGPGMGVLLGGGFRILPCLDARCSIGYSVFSPTSFTLDTGSGPEDNELTKYSVIWFALSPRFYALVDRPTRKWFSLNPKAGYRGFAPYGGFHLGLTFNEGVEWPTPTPKWEFWGSGVSSLFEVYFGAEFRFTETVGAFAELGLPIIGPPPADSIDPKYTGMNEAASMTAFRLSIGLLMAF